MSGKKLGRSLLVCAVGTVLCGDALAATQECTGGTLGVSTSIQEGFDVVTLGRIAFIEEEVTIVCGGAPVIFRVKTGGANPDDEAVVKVLQQQLKNILSMALIAQTQPAVRAVVNTDAGLFEFFVLGAAEL